MFALLKSLMNRVSCLRCFLALSDADGSIDSPGRRANKRANIYSPFYRVSIFNISVCLRVRACVCVSSVPSGPLCLSVCHPLSQDSRLQFRKVSLSRPSVCAEQLLHYLG